VLFPAGRLASDTWAHLVMPKGRPIIGSDMSDDMRLCALSWETAGSTGSETLSLGMSGPLGCSGATVSSATAGLKGHEVTADRGGLFALHFAVSGADPAPGSGRPMAGWFESPGLASSLALRLPVEGGDDLAVRNDASND
jgi:hypothetical protein